jgi:hypothetical protein
MPEKPKFTAAQVVEALNATKGLIFLAARRLGCHYNTITNYAKRYASVRECLEASRGEMVDAGESSLFRAVLNGEAWAVQFLLKTLGKSRGYVERTETRIGGADDAPPVRFDRTPVPLEQLPTELVEKILEFLTTPANGKAAANGTAAPPAPARAAGRRETRVTTPPPAASDDEELVWEEGADAVGAAQEGEGGPGGR